jgi:outer membrane protein W
MRKAIVAIFALCIVGAWSVASAADGKNLFRFGGAFVSPTGDLSGEESDSADLGDGTMISLDGTLTLEPQSEFALLLGYERRFTDLFGLEFVAWNAKHDVDGRFSGEYWLLDSDTGKLIENGTLQFTETLGDVKVMPLTAGLNFHLTRQSRFDLYVGPTVGYVFYGNLDVEGERLSIDDDFTWGATLGFDLPMGGKGWMLTGALRYLDTEASPDDLGPGDQALDVAPWVVQVSAGYRF